MTTRPAPMTQPNPPPADNDDEAPRLVLRGRSLAVFGLFVALAAVALYFLLPRRAGRDDTWQRIEEGSPAGRARAARGKRGGLVGDGGLLNGGF